VRWRSFCTFSSVLVEDRPTEASKTKTKIGQFVGFGWTHGFIMGTLLKHFINNGSWFLWVNIKLAANSAISLVYEDHSTHPAQIHLHVVCKNTRSFCAIFTTVIYREWNQRYLTTHSCVTAG
jgi:hypothetical protein